MTDLTIAMPEGLRIALTAILSGVRRTGGARSTSWAVLVMMGLILILDRVGTDLQRTGEPILLVSSGLMGASAIAVVLRSARSTVLRGAADRPRPAIAAVSLVAAGAAAAVVGHLHDSAVGLPSDASLAHLFERTGWAVGFLVVLTIAADALTEHRTLFETIALRTTTLMRTRDEVTELLSRGVHAELDLITRDVRADLAVLDSADRDGAVRHLRHAFDEVIRSRSRELVQASVPFRPTVVPTVLPQRTLYQLAVDATVDRPLRPAVPSVFVALWAIGASTADLGILTAAGIGIAFGITTAAIIGPFGVLAHRLTRAAQPAARIAITSLATLAAAMTWALASQSLEVGRGIPLPSGGDNVQIAVQALLLTAVPIAQSLGRAARRQDERAVTELRRITRALEHEVARANSDLWAKRRALARALHGPIQATISAAALRLAMVGDDAAAVGSAVTQACTEIEDALTELERRVIEDRLDAGDDLDRAIARIRGLWEGVVDVDITVSPGLVHDLAADPTMTAALVDVLTEACSNAVRHGRAQHVRARLHDEHALVALEVVDDGLPGTIGAPGGGSALLDEVTLAWQRTHDATGTRLTASFARS